MMRVRSPKPSYVTVPDSSGGANVVDFLAGRFPKISRQCWEERVAGGVVIDSRGSALDIGHVCRPRERIAYFREVKEEVHIPFREEVVFRNDRILVACKPHFLPVHPAGPYVNECLLSRLRRTFSCDDIVPVNRLDRETAGLVLFSADRATRGKYYSLFMKRHVWKFYEAVAEIPHGFDRDELTVESRIEKSSPWFLCRNAEGVPNSTTKMRLAARKGNIGLFYLEPLTGRQHQLRLHMSLIGAGILNDYFYPVLREERKTGFDRPLQLLAKKMSFSDPVTGENMYFESKRRLSAWDGGQHE